jgi:Iron-containing redox enzyme
LGRTEKSRLAPFNLVDGAWLQNIITVGPVGKIQSNLFSIWDDEAGNGVTSQNHCNVYDALLRSQNIYLPPITTREFIEQDFLPGAFTASIFELAVGNFPQAFFPELLGMTLYLEWEATPTLTAAARMLVGRGMNPIFYRLHVAIDNISEGHGALAKEAVKLYLEGIREEGGDIAVQEHWLRVRNGSPWLFNRYTPRSVRSPAVHVAQQDPPSFRRYGSKVARAGWSGL